MISIMNYTTGEVTEFADGSPEEIKNSWLAISQQIKDLEKAKDMLKPKVAELLDEFGKYEFEDYMFRQTTVQRRNYDKAVMREALDEDTLDLFLVPDKPRVDQYIKEHLEELGEVSTLLRKTMVTVGNPYTTVRLEKVTDKDHA